MRRQIFIRITGLFSVLTICFGLLKLFMAYSVLSGSASPDVISGTTGEKIDEGMLCILAGVVMGAIYEIGTAVCRLEEQKNKEIEKEPMP